MGPLTLFDKSFLEMISIDEAAIFDCLFSSVICPVFFSETLADLSKVGGRAHPEKLVADIARKTPILGSYPNVFHRSLLENELRGQPTNLRGVPAIAHGKFTIDSDGRRSILYSESPEAEAFDRWQHGRFREIERDFAASWRNALSRADHASLATLARGVFSISDTPRNTEEAFKIAQSAVLRPEQAGINIVAGSVALGLDHDDAEEALSRWEDAGSPALDHLFPYFVHCLKVELFFHVAVDKTLISPERASNKLDITYLYYLPFCQIFVSNDKLHRRSAPLFMRGQQIYVQGQELKEDLTKLVAHYEERQDEIEREGLFRVASRPPKDTSFLSRRIWDQLMRKPQGQLTEPDATKRMTDREGRGQLATVQDIKARISSMRDGPSLQPTFPLDMDDIDQVAIQRMVPLRRGRWRLLPEGVKPDEE